MIDELFYFQPSEVLEVRAKVKKIEFVEDYMLDEPTRKGTIVMVCEDCMEDIFLGDRCLVSPKTILCQDCLENYTKEEGWE